LEICKNIKIMKKVTIAKGDGIGPEIMNAVIKIIKAANTPIDFEEIEIGEKVYLAGNSSGISDSSWDVIRRNKVLLKAPITTPQGGGYKSLNVTMRKALGLYANIRPCLALHPFVATNFPKLDIVIVRENEEDLYAGIEHQQTDEVVQCLKLISRPGCEKIIRYAFEYAKNYGRKKITCFSKDNIMKQTDGLFHQVFKEIAMEYPEIESNHMIIDIGTAYLADHPEKFDVIVTSNLYGDIISDVAAQIAGSVGLAGSVNIGNECSMFEAIHGSAPDIAGKNIANPSGLLQAAIAMLYHLGFSENATMIQNAWLKTLEDGIHTADIFNIENSKINASTSDFENAVIANFSKQPQILKAVTPPQNSVIKLPAYTRKPAANKELLGVDLFVHWTGTDANLLANRLNQLIKDDISLVMISNRGVKVWPNGFLETFCTDHWRCRFQSNAPISKGLIVNLLGDAIELGIDVIKTENLYQFNGTKAYSMGQGQ
jgi:isocitrate dehydrogenase